MGKKKKKEAINEFRNLYIRSYMQMLFFPIHKACSYEIVVFWI